MEPLELTEKDCKKILKNAEDSLADIGELIPAIIDQAGCGSSLEAVYFFLDVYNDGACMGSPGFTYYTQTEAFFDNHRTEIVRIIFMCGWILSPEMAGQSDCEDIVKYLQSDSRLSEYQTMLLSLVLAGKDEGEDQNEVMDIKNDLVWFVLDVIADIVHGFVYYV